jgi:hypothetical protein
MFNTQEVARYRMADTMRRSEAARVARDAAAPRQAERRATRHRMAVATLGLMLWPIRH